MTSLSKIEINSLAQTLDTHLTEFPSGQPYDDSDNRYYAQPDVKLLSTVIQYFLAEFPEGLDAQTLLQRENNFSSYLKNMNKTHNGKLIPLLWENQKVLENEFNLLFLRIPYLKKTGKRNLVWKSTSSGLFTIGRFPGEEDK